MFQGNPKGRLGVKDKPYKGSLLYEKKTTRERKRGVQILPCLKDTINEELPRAIGLEFRQKVEELRENRGIVTTYRSFLMKFGRSFATRDCVLSRKLLSIHRKTVEKHLENCNMELILRQKQAAVFLQEASNTLKAR
jgi:hypothetical protein